MYSFIDMHAVLLTAKAMVLGCERAHRYSMHVLQCRVHACCLRRLPRKIRHSSLSWYQSKFQCERRVRLSIVSSGKLNQSRQFLICISDQFWGSAPSFVCLFLLARVCVFFRSFVCVFTCVCCFCYLYSVSDHENNELGMNSVALAMSKLVWYFCEWQSFLKFRVTASLSCKTFS